MRMHSNIIITIITNIKATKSNRHSVPFNGGESGLSGSVRMEGMQNINIGWTRISHKQLSGFSYHYFSCLLYVRQVRVFDYKPHFCPTKFSIIRITYMLKVLCVANSDKNPLFPNCIHIVKVKCI